ncbi:hypothetical protein BGZ80_010622 [Entomortierella chlamydospora]|uniref:DUF647-domain-containing protein n=1 Tax=Entomortierella chlamydospora TaxID=101097 RepID=A0A9P6T3W6_9FUNG|nr:hypothetical protein BGZ79_005964 [Entomortierella chlamydospora]KAG0023002.1 hypothetical protein BGZ80_010622 [Entomortierella chlamydospora]
MLFHTIRSSGHYLRRNVYIGSSPRQIRSYYILRALTSTVTHETRASSQARSYSSRPNPINDNIKDITAINSLNIKQRRSGTWMPKWQILTLSNDNLSDPTKFKASPDLHPVKDGSVEEANVTKYLLSPQKALAVFLPKGFPESVTPNYWPFAKWQFIHNVAGSVTAVISTQSLLFAMGLGAGSIPMAAALNWIIKDGLGQLGGVVYASFVSDKFDSEPKRFRFQATVAMQGANLLELLTPLWPGYFLVIASISNIGKNMAWLASSATRAQMNKTFALRDNLGDITGKSGSQTTAAGLVGTGLGVVIAALMSFVSEDPTVLPLVPMCLTFIPFSIFNIYSNYRSSYYVTTSSLNVPRAETVFHSVLNELVLDKEDYNKEAPATGHLRQQLEALVPAPVEVAYDEVFVKPYKSPFNVAIDIEPSITRFASQGEEAGALSLAFRQTEFVQRERYYIMTDESLVRGGRAGLCNGKVVIWFDKKAQTRDMVQGFYHACAARVILGKSIRQKNSSEGVSGTESDEWKKAVRAAHEQAIDTVPTLVEVMDQKGWDTTSLFLTDGDRNRIELE